MAFGRARSPRGAELPASLRAAHPGVADLVAHMLARDPALRPSAAPLLAGWSNLMQVRSLERSLSDLDLAGGALGGGGGLELLEDASRSSGGRSNSSSRSSGGSSRDAVALSAREGELLASSAIVATDGLLFRRGRSSLPLPLPASAMNPLAPLAALASPAARRRALDVVQCLRARHAALEGELRARDAIIARQQAALERLRAQVVALGGVPDEDGEGEAGGGAAGVIFEDGSIASIEE